MNTKSFREKYEEYYWAVFRHYVQVKKHPKILIGLYLLLAAILLYHILFWYPHHAIAEFNITNPKDIADAENSYRATMAQILGGIAIGIGLYYTWRRVTIAEKDLKVSQEGQITERFTRAVDQLGAIDQLGNPAIEIRLGGIYALERIANESDKDYWPIMEILTAYVRKNSWYARIHYYEMLEIKGGIDQSCPNEVSLDIQAILTVIARRRHSFSDGELTNLNLQGTYLEKADLMGANLKKVKLSDSNLAGADLRYANLIAVELINADLDEAKLEAADFFLANLRGAQYLTVDQFSKVQTLYLAKLDPELEKPLRMKYPALFKEPQRIRDM